MKHTLNQHKAQAHAAGQNIRAAALDIAASEGLTLAAAEAKVFADPKLLARCHERVPKMSSTPPDWSEPE